MQMVKKISEPAKAPLFAPPVNRSKPVMLRLTPEEFRAIESRAKELGLERVDVIRAALAMYFAETGKPQT